MVDEIRAISPEEYGAWNWVQYAGFSNIPDAGELARWRSRTDFDRAMVAVDDGEIVGAASSCMFTTHVPGGAMVPTAAVTAVAVLPSHRRLGVLTSMMHRQLDEVRMSGEPLAALWASESPIYGRFGYGLSIHGEEWNIDRVRAGFAVPIAGEGNGRVRFIDRAAALDRFPAVHERAARSTLGMMQPPAGWWLPQYGNGDWNEAAQKEEPFLVVFERDGLDEGFASYQVSGFDQNIRELTVKSLYATTPEAHEGLWRFILSVDLVDKIRAPYRAVDDPLPWMLRDWRQLERRSYDMIWLRLVDVPSALTARRYSTAGRIVLGVRDEFCAWNNGRYVLEVGEDGRGSCSISNEALELELSVDVLAAAYLGGVPLTTLASARLVQEYRPGALRLADTMFQTNQAPWTGLDF